MDISKTQLLVCGGDDEVSLQFFQSRKNKT
jgi:hypothetical protein